MRQIIYAVIAVSIAFAPLHAGTFSFGYDGTATSGNYNEDVVLTFTTSPGLLQLTVVNKETDPGADNQAVSQIFFNIDSAGLLNLFGSYGSTTAINISAGGAWTANSASNSNPVCDTVNVSGCHWAFSATPGSGVTTIELNALSGGQPNQLLLGDPQTDGSTSGNYTSANGSITNTHNPWLQHSMTWDITSTDPTTSTALGNLSVSDLSLVALNFTTTGCSSNCQTATTNTSVPNIPTLDTTPEPGTIALFGGGMALIAFGSYRRRKPRK